MNTTDIFLMDTCVVSDFIRTSPERLRELRSHGCNIFILEEIREELLREFDYPTIANLALSIVDVEMKEYDYALSIDSHALSSQDKLCISVAKNREMICVTKDFRMKKECDSKQVQVLWSLQFLLKLRDNCIIDTDTARQWGTEMQRLSNSRIPQNALEEFLSELGDVRS